MTLNGLSLIGDVIILCAHHHSPSTKVPKALRLVVLQFLGKLLCQSHTGTEVSPDDKAEKWAEKSKVRDEKITKLVAHSPDRGSFVLPTEVTELVKLELRKERHQEEMEQNKTDWEEVAVILDRLFLIMYYTIFVVSGIYLLVKIQPY